jgi:hypothetical protein
VWRSLANAEGYSSRETEITETGFTGIVITGADRRIIGEGQRSSMALHLRDHCVIMHGVLRPLGARRLF